jgi:hypothetical protein
MRHLTSSVAGQGYSESSLKWVNNVESMVFENNELEDELLDVSEAIFGRSRLCDDISGRSRSYDDISGDGMMGSVGSLVHSLQNSTTDCLLHDRTR